ncbi:hypothetical protein Tco_0792128 [Tanacetum coccineum]
MALRLQVPHQQEMSKCHRVCAIKGLPQPPVLQQGVNESPQVEGKAPVKTSIKAPYMGRDVYVGIPSQFEFAGKIVDTGHIEYTHAPNLGLKGIFGSYFSVHGREEPIIAWTKHKDYDENVIHSQYCPMLKSGLGFGGHDGFTHYKGIVNMSINDSLGCGKSLRSCAHDITKDELL